MSYRFADSLRANLYQQIPDDGQRNCPKHVEFYSKNKFEKLVHLVGFIIRIYHDARSPECRIGIKFFVCTHWNIHKQNCIMTERINIYIKHVVYMKSPNLLSSILLPKI